MPVPQPRSQGHHEDNGATACSEVPQGQRLDMLAGPIYTDLTSPPNSLQTAGSKMQAIPTGKGTRQSSPHIYGICLSK